MTHTVNPWLLGARFTRFTGISRGNPTQLTKTFRYEDGRLVKSPPPNAGVGVYSNIYSGFDGLAHILATMKPNECLVSGWTDAAEGRITLARWVGPGYISRTKDFFAYPQGPGLILLDHDADADHVAMTPERLLSALVEISPIFGKAGRVVTYSTSAGVHAPDGRLLSPRNPSFHTYFLAADGTDIPRFGAVLFKRLWLAGYGWGALSRAGSFLKRGIIDAAVFSPERCIFEAPPILHDGLTQDRPKPKAFYGAYLDTHALPDLSDAEEARFQQLVAAERQRLKPEQEPRRRQYAKVQAEENGTTEEHEYRQIRAIDRRVIDGNTILGHDGATLWEMIRQGRHGGYVTDPVEPDRADARLFIDGPGDAKLHSFQHGGCQFQVVPTEIAAAVADAPEDEFEARGASGVPFWVRSRFVAMGAISSAAKVRHTAIKVAPEEFRLPDGPLIEGVWLLRGPCGVGKTKNWGVPLFQAAEAAGLRCVAICHRISLTADLVTKLGCHNYQEKGGLGAHRSLAICVNSIVREEYQAFCIGADVLFIDEIAQVLRHVTTGSVADKERAKVFELLGRMVGRAKLVVGADADADDLVVEFLERFRPGVRFKIVETELDHSHLHVTVAHGEKAFDALCRDVVLGLDDGQRLIVASDSKTKLERLMLAVREALPNKKVILLTGETRNHNDHKAFVERPNEACVDYDLVLHSPSVSSGVSIECEHFDRGYGIFGGKISPSDAHQMMRRVRNLRAWNVVLFSLNNQKRLDNAEAILGAEHTAARLSGSLLAPTTLDEFTARVKADNHFAASHFAAGFLSYLRRAGFTVTELVDDTGFGDQGEELHIPAIDVAARLQDIVDARHIDDEEAKRLQKTLRIGDDDGRALRRWLVVSALKIAPAELTAADVAWWDDGRGAKRLRRFELATGRRRPAEDVRRDLSLRDFEGLKARLWREVLAPLGVDLATGVGSYGEAEAARVVDTVAQRPNLFGHLGIAPQMGGTRPVSAIKFVGQILARLGLKQVGRKVRGAGTRTWKYEVDAEGFAEQARRAMRRVAGPDGAVLCIQTLP